MFSCCSVILLQILGRTQAIQVSEELPWDLGKKYPTAWTGYLMVLISGLLSNGFSLYLIKFKKRVRTIALANLIFAMNSIDFLMSLFCFCQCLLNMLHKEQYGHSAGCAAQALQLGFFEFWEAFTLALIAFCLERKVCAGLEFTDTRVLLVVIKTGVFAFFLSACACYLPYGGYHLYPSGTFCFLNLNHPVPACILAGAIVIPTIIMVQRYMRIWNCIRSAQAILSGRGLEIKAKARYSQMAKKMSLFTLTFFGCATPCLACAIYEWATGEYTSPWFDELSGTVLHLASIINPILFFELNEDVREVLYQEYGISIVFWRMKCREKNRALVVQPKVHCDIRPVQDLPCRNRFYSYPSLTCSDAKEWKLWVQQEALAKDFLSWSAQNHVVENVMFYQDIVKFKQVANDVKAKITQWLDADQELFPSEIKEEWHVQLFQMTSQIYEMYIHIPKAPLEINIPALTHNKILETLGIAAVEKQASDVSIPKFADVWLLHKSEAIEALTNVAQVYDDALKHVCTIIKQDLFPRFKNSAYYHPHNCQEVGV